MLKKDDLMKKPKVKERSLKMYNCSQGYGKDSSVETKPT